jgi:hypothetical protein
LLWLSAAHLPLVEMGYDWPMALYSEDLQNAHCATPGCNHDDCQLILYSKCHRSPLAKVAYDKATRTLVVTCAACDKVIGSFHVERIRPETSSS